jgi:acetyl-CoA carboxylase carboxyl transferase subunit alpha
VGDRILMFENAIYSVISPEGCAAILWKDAAQSSLAAESLKLTAVDLLELGLIDAIVPEPEGGAHIAAQEAAKMLDSALWESLTNQLSLSDAERQSQRYKKLRKLDTLR